MNMISAADIIVERITPVNKGNLKAFCTVRLPGGVKINSCRVVEQPEHAAWVSMPQTEWSDSDGKRHYSPIVEVPTELNQAISQAVLTAWGTMSGRCR